MSKIDDVARGLLVDAFITYAAICREKGYSREALSVWSIECEKMGLRTDDSHFGQSDDTTDAIVSVFHEKATDGFPAFVQDLIEERRGLVRDTMREEMADLEAASPPAEDAEGIRDERQG